MMKLPFVSIALLALLYVYNGAAKQMQTSGNNIRGGGGRDVPKLTQRSLEGSGGPCIGNTLKVQQKLKVGKRLCATIDGERVYLKVQDYPDHDNAKPNHTLYCVVIWSEDATFYYKFGCQQFPDDDDPPALRMQQDGHLTLGGKTTTDLCRAKPNKRGDGIRAVLGNKKDVFQVFDDDDDLIWKVTLVKDDDGRYDCYRGVSDRSDSACIGDTLKFQQTLQVGERLCATIDGERVYLKVQDYPDHDNAKPDHTMYCVVIWSEDETFDYEFGCQHFPDDEDPPALRMQQDGHLTLGGKTTTGMCRAKPDKRDDGIRAVLGHEEDVFQVFDDDGDLIWKVTLEKHDDDNVPLYDCYLGEIDAKCVSVLKEKERLTWNEYICEYDSDGDVVAKFGLDTVGMVALWRGEKAVWSYRPQGSWLHLQRDGKLVLYEGEDPLEYEWKSGCKGENTKITVSDGDVHQFNGNGSTAWALSGESPEPVCFKTCD